MKLYNPRRQYKHPFKEPARQDPYRSTSKPKSRPRCPSCSSVSVRGRWLSPEQTEELKTGVVATRELKCPACQQKEDHFALGVVELRGESWRRNKESIMNMVRNTEAIARHRNDQERILWVQELKTMTKVYVALPELARKIGRELEKSFQGYTEYSRSTEEAYLRVRWWPTFRHMKHRPGHPFRRTLELRESSAGKMRANKSRAFRARSGS